MTQFKIIAMRNILNSLSSDWKIGRDTGLLIFRLIFGLVLFYGHGFEKLSVILSGNEIHFMDPIGIGESTSYHMAAFAEGICALLVILGLFTRVATLILSINFLVIFIFHAFIVGDGFAVLELRFFYLFAFIGLTLTGPGRFSLDYLFFQRKNELEKT